MAALRPTTGEGGNGLSAGGDCVLFRRGCTPIELLLTLTRMGLGECPWRMS